MDPLNLVSFCTPNYIYQTYWPGFSNINDTGHAGLTWYSNFVARQQSPSRKSIHATEVGYTNYIPDLGVSEEAEEKYMARLYAELFRRGVVRTCQYELVDEDKQGREGLFGLLRLNITEKPAFRALKTLITLLSDKRPDFKPDSFNYAFDGNITGIRHMPLQKRNGAFYIMYWLEVAS